MTNSVRCTYRSQPFISKRTSELIAGNPNAAARHQQAGSGYAQHLVQEILENLLPYSEDRNPVELSQPLQVSEESILSSLSDSRSRHFSLTEIVRTRLREIAYFTLLSDETHYGLNLEWNKADSKIVRFQLVAIDLRYFNATQVLRSKPYFQWLESSPSSSQQWKSRTLSFGLPTEYRTLWKPILESLSLIDTLPMPPYVQRSMGSKHPLYHSYDVDEYNSAMEVAVSAATAPIGWVHSWAIPPKSVNDYVFCARRLGFLTFCARVRESILDEISRCLEPHLPGWGFPLRTERLPTSEELSDASQTLESSGSITDSRIRSLLYLPAKVGEPGNTA